MSLLDWSDGGNVEASLGPPPVPRTALSPAASAFGQIKSTGDKRLGSNRDEPRSRVNGVKYPVFFVLLILMYSQ